MFILSTVGLFLLLIGSWIWIYQRKKLKFGLNNFTYHIRSVLYPLNIPRLTLIIGPMFAGKTGEIIRRLQRFNHAEYSCLVIKHTLDQRFNGNIDELKLMTHDGTTFKMHTSGHKLELVYTPDLDALKNKVNQFDVIILEEGHMWENKWWDFVYYCLYEHQKQVIVSTIDSYSPEQNEIQPISELAIAVIHSTEIVKLTSICSKCLHDTAVVSCSRGPKRQTIEVGGAEKYVPQCWLCTMQK